MKSVLKKIGMVLGGGFVIFVIIGIIAVNSGPSREATGQASAVVPQPAVASAQVVKAVKPTPAEPVEPIRTTASALAAAYNENEVAVDKKIGGRPVEVAGNVQSVDKGVLGSVVVSLATGNQFMPARLTVNSDQVEAASELRRGHSVVVVCREMRLVLGMPAGDDCVIKPKAAGKR